MQNRIDSMNTFYIIEDPCYKELPVEIFLNEEGVYEIIIYYHNCLNIMTRGYLLKNVCF